MPTHRGKRSQEAIERRNQKHDAKKYVWKYSFPDTIISETACRSSRDEVKDHLLKLYGNYDSAAVPEVSKGVILKDSRGKGFYQ
jgi:hypothetical protein